VAWPRPPLILFEQKIGRNGADRLSTASSTEKGLPMTFLETENVKWVAKLPGPSAGTPIIWNDRVFVSSVDERAGTLQAICLDRANGKAPGNTRPAPESGGRQEQLCFTFSGHRRQSGLVLLRQRSTGRIRLRRQTSLGPEHTEGPRPIRVSMDLLQQPDLLRRRLYLQILQRDVPVHGRGRTDGPIDSFLLALDPQTGKELWKISRPNEAREESKESYATPIPFTSNNRTELLIAGGDCLTGHDPANGKELRAFPANP